MSRLKDGLYNYFVRKNGRVWYEYERYVREHMEEHHLHRFHHIKILVKLNWFYRIKKGSTPYLYWDTPLDPKAETEEKEITGVKSTHTDNSESAIFEHEKKIQIPESTIQNRPEPYHFVLGLLPYDVISFDIFDTLVLRPFADPKDLFNVIGRRMRYPAVFTGYKQGRFEAEREARDEREKKYANREVNIYEIYEQMERKMGVDKEEGVRTEIAAELDYTFANPYMQIVFNILKSQGKTIVLTSDMYLPGDVIETLVKKCGYEGYDKIYVSCDYRCNKMSGELYRRVINDYKGKSIVHIGDSVVADINGARKVGLDTRYYKNVNEAGKPNRGEWMAELTGSAYAGLVNAYIHNGVRKYPFFYEYGFIYGGIYVWGFCQWMEKRAAEEGIDKLIFLSRDGDIYQKVYNKYFNSIENDYVFWSRFANLKYLIEMNQDAFVDRVIKQKALGTLNVEIKSVFDSLAIEVEESQLHEYGLYFDTILTGGNKNALTMFIKDHWEMIEKSYERERELVINEVKEFLGNKKKIAVVDVGWTASGPLGFKAVVDKYFPAEYDIKCWMAGGAGGYGSGSSVIPYYLDGTVESYMFSPLHNKRNAQIHVSENVAVTNNAVFELFTQTQYPSFRGRSEDGGYEFDIPENENYALISQIHQGIMDFCELYMKTFKKDSYLYNISGFDAYRPFAKLAFDKSFFEENFANVSFAYGLSGDNSKQCVETIGERAKHYYAHNGGKK